MTFIWLIVWLLSSTPHVSFNSWNSWAIALVVCAGLDLLGVLEHER